MAARLGDVLWWLSWIIAIPAFIWTATNGWVLANGSSRPGENMLHIMVSLGIAIGALLIGRACRYILAGR
jgi:hypothetical protein